MTGVTANYTGWTASDAIAQTSSDKDKLKGVAKQFEAIFVRQMLSAARKTDFGGDDLFGNGAVDTFREMQDSQFADIMADTGKLGLGKLIEAHMAKFVSGDQKSAENAPASSVLAK